CIPFRRPVESHLYLPGSGPLPSDRAPTCLCPPAACPLPARRPAVQGSSDEIAPREDAPPCPPARPARSRPWSCSRPRPPCRPRRTPPAPPPPPRRPCPPPLHLVGGRQPRSVKPAWPDQPKLQVDAVYEPVVLGKRLFVGSSCFDSVTAYDTESGKELWCFHA